MSDLATATQAKAAPAVDLKLEIVVIPVSDVERAKQFYAKLAGGSMPTLPAPTITA